MAKALKVNDTVFVPAGRVGIPASPSAMYETTVSKVKPNGRSVEVGLPGGAISQWIGTSLAHRTVGALVIRIGDLASEPALLDPLAKALLQYFRLLVPDSQARLLEVRSVKELELFWATDQPVYSHVVIIGHGRADAIQFAVDGWVQAPSLASALAAANSNPKVFISLCCATGMAAFAKNFSRAKACAHWIAPFQELHGAVGSDFCQSYFSHHFIAGHTVKVSFTHANASMPPGTSFRLWRAGSIAKGA